MSRWRSTALYMAEHFAGQGAVGARLARRRRRIREHARQRAAGTGAFVPVDGGLMSSFGIAG